MNAITTASLRQNFQEEPNCLAIDDFFNNHENAGIESKSLLTLIVSALENNQCDEITIAYTISLAKQCIEEWSKLLDDFAYGYALPGWKEFAESQQKMADSACHALNVLDDMFGDLKPNWLDHSAVLAILQSASGNVSQMLNQSAELRKNYQTDPGVLR